MRCIDCGEWHDGDSDLCPTCHKKYAKKTKREAGLLGMPYLWRLRSLQLLGEKE